jgi:hypothetical protein
MLRVLLIASLGAGLLSVGQAEAAKIRFGGGKRAADAPSPSSTPMLIPGLRASRSTAPATREPERAPFPPSTATPAFVSLDTREPDRPWCQSKIVVGGFCVLN